MPMPHEPQTFIVDQNVLFKFMNEENNFKIKIGNLMIVLAIRPNSYTYKKKL